MLDKNLLGYLSLFLAVLSGAPYIWSMFAGKTRPHIFTWILWALLSAVAAAAQYSAHAGPGAWAAAMSAAFALVTAALSLLQDGDRSITRSDWVSFIAALSIFPLWYITASPLAAALLATSIDALGYAPTFRKSYSRPQEEMLFTYLISNLKHAASVLATVEYSLTTLVFPVVVFAMNTAFILMVVWRRRALAG